MSPADAVFSHCRFVWLGQTNVPVVFLDPGINRTASLPNVHQEFSVPGYPSRAKEN
jgi:hypothetical protein